MDKKLTAYSEKCTGCKICQMICSWSKYKVFSPCQAQLDIAVDEKNAAFHISFKEGCNSCSICTRYCPSGAIQVLVGGESS